MRLLQLGFGLGLFRGSLSLGLGAPAGILFGLGLGLGFGFGSGLGVGFSLLLLVQHGLFFVRDPFLLFAAQGQYAGIFGHLSGAAGGGADRSLALFAPEIIFGASQIVFRLLQTVGGILLAPAALAMATALRASSKVSGVLGSAVAEGSCWAGTSMVYWPPSSMSNLASMASSKPLVSCRMMFSATTSLLGRVTEK